MEDVIPATEPGRLIAVVGPSGVGKDSVIRGLAKARPGLVAARRVITRNPLLGGEDFEAVSDQEFAQRSAAGAFCLEWQAHGLRYGIPTATLDEVEAGRDVLVNLSRSVLLDARAACPGLRVIALTAAPETLARRLAGRGREGAEEIRLRLARAAPLPPGLPVLSMSNDGPLTEVVRQTMAHLYPESR